MMKEVLNFSCYFEADSRPTISLFKRRIQSYNLFLTLIESSGLKKFREHFAFDYRMGEIYETLKNLDAFGF